MAITVTHAGPADAAELAAVAAATFPLACPPSVSDDDVAAFVAEHLSPECFADYRADPTREVLAVRDDDRIIGYAMLVREETSVVELSKIYLLPAYHGTDAARTLMDAVIARAAGFGAGEVRLGVNQNNERAQRFYRKHGFEVTGTRTFTLGSSVQDDYIMSRAL